MLSDELLLDQPTIPFLGRRRDLRLGALTSLFGHLFEALSHDILVLSLPYFEAERTVNESFFCPDLLLVLLVL